MRAMRAGRDAYAIRLSGNNDSISDKIAPIARFPDYPITRLPDSPIPDKIAPITRFQIAPITRFQIAPITRFQIKCN
jgi:hypothetical protein